MRKRKIAITSLDKAIEELLGRTDHRILGIWAADCAESVLPYFEEKFPRDNRPRDAIAYVDVWAKTGVLRMAEVRGASLAAHAAARDAGEDNAARSAARAAGQAAATAHVPTHSLGAANYALQAVFRASESAEAEAAVAREREWQYHHLRGLMDNAPK